MASLPGDELVNEVPGQREGAGKGRGDGVEDVSGAGALLDQKVPQHLKLEAEASNADQKLWRAFGQLTELDV